MTQSATAGRHLDLEDCACHRVYSSFCTAGASHGFGAGGRMQLPRGTSHEWSLAERSATQDPALCSCRPAGQPRTHHKVHAQSEDNIPQSSLRFNKGYCFQDAESGWFGR